MNQKWIYLLLSVLLIVCAILMLIEKEEDLIILSSDSVFSIYHSNDLETFNIEIMTNSKDNYYLVSDYISNARILNEKEEVSVNIKEIIIDNNYVNYGETKLYKVLFNTELNISTDNSYILIDNAFMEIDYINGKTITFRIGEFNYLFQSNTNDISLNNLSATHEKVDGVNTVGGINLDLGNRSDMNINVTSIKILSAGVKTNLNYNLKREACDNDKKVTDCLGIEYYNFHESIEQSVNLLLGRNNHIELYIPLVYTQDVSFIHRFAILVDYEINGESKTFIIDDFPFIKTEIFNDEVKDDYHVYEIID